MADRNEIGNRRAKNVAHLYKLDQPCQSNRKQKGGNSATRRGLRHMVGSAGISDCVALHMVEMGRIEHMCACILGML